MPKVVNFAISIVFLIFGIIIEPIQPTNQNKTTMTDKRKEVFAADQITDGLQYRVTIDEYHGQYEITFSVQALIFLQAKVLSVQRKATSPDDRTALLESIIREHEAAIEKLKNQIR